MVSDIRSVDRHSQQYSEAMRQSRALRAATKQIAPTRGSDGQQRKCLTRGSDEVADVTSRLMGSGD